MGRITGGTTWICLAVLVGTLLAWVSDSDWVARSRAASWYGLPYGKVQLSGARPRDCDFLTRPIGEKNCSYEREFLVEWRASSATRWPITYGGARMNVSSTCSRVDLNLQRICYEVERLPEERASALWRAQQVEIVWRKVED